MLLLVSYDLKNPGRDYTTLIAQLKALKAVRPLESLWVLESPNTPIQMRDHLQKFIDPNDKLFVTTCAGAAAWKNIDNTTVNTLMNLYK